MINSPEPEELYSGTCAKCDNSYIIGIIKKRTNLQAAQYCPSCGSSNVEYHTEVSVLKDLLNDLSNPCVEFPITSLPNAPMSGKYPTRPEPSLQVFDDMKNSLNAAQELTSIAEQYPTKILKAQDE